MSANTGMSEITMRDISTIVETG